LVVGGFLESRMVFVRNRTVCQPGFCPVAQYFYAARRDGCAAIAAKYPIYAARSAVLYTGLAQIGKSGRATAFAAGARDTEFGIRDSGFGVRKRPADHCSLFAAHRSLFGVTTANAPVSVVDALDGRTLPGS
jgi:hypothetical protein